MHSVAPAYQGHVKYFERQMEVADHVFADVRKHAV